MLNNTPYQNTDKTLPPSEQNNIKDPKQIPPLLPMYVESTPLFPPHFTIEWLGVQLSTIPKQQKMNNILHKKEKDRLISLKKKYTEALDYLNKIDKIKEIEL